MASKNLYSEFQLGDLTLPNRIIMAPMTRNRAGEGNVPTALMAEYYTQRVSAGFMVTEATQVMPEGVGYPNTPGIYSKEQVEGWKQVTTAVHKAGGRIFLQLWHVGRISHPLFQPGGVPPVAPSAIAPAGKIFTSEGPKPFETPRALETSEIAGIVEKYRQGAINAHEAGFDGVELHGANGYLIDQFLRDGTNQRTDQYGGSLENRVRFLMEVTNAVLDEWDEDRVGVRLSPSGSFNDMKDSNPVETFSLAVSELDSVGVGYIHIIEGTAIDARHGGVIVPTELLQALIFNSALMVNGGYTRERAEAVIQQGEADLVSFAQLFLANPDLPERLKTGAPLNIPDKKTFYGGNEKGYTDYPTLHALPTV